MAHNAYEHRAHMRIAARNLTAKAVKAETDWLLNGILAYNPERDIATWTTFTWKDRLWCNTCGQLTTYPKGQPANIRKHRPSCNTTSEPIWIPPTAKLVRSIMTQYATKLRALPGIRMVCCVEQGAEPYNWSPNESIQGRWHSHALTVSSNRHTNKKHRKITQILHEHHGHIKTSERRGSPAIMGYTAKHQARRPDYPTIILAATPTSGGRRKIISE